MAFITTVKLYGKELAEKDAEFRDKIFTDPEASEAALLELRAFFQDVSPAKDWEYRVSYFRWYTELVWRRLNSQTREVLIDVAIARQLPLAMLMDIDVWREMMWYLAAWVVSDEQDLQGIYAKIKKAFLESEAIVGYWQGKEISVAQLVKELNTISIQGSNSLEVAEYNSKIKEIMSAKNDPELSKYVLLDPNDAVVRFIDLVNFFVGITPDTIWYVVDVFAHPEEITPVVPGEAPGAATTAAVVAVGTAAASSAMPAKREEVPAPVAPKKEVGTNPPLPKRAPPDASRDPRSFGIGTSGESPKTIVQAKPPTSAEIKKLVEEQFSAQGGSASGGKKDADGQFADIEGVLAKLGELAEKYHDPKIAELIYFDESSGEFKWNV